MWVPLCCLLSAHPVTCLLSRRKGTCFRPVSPPLLSLFLPLSLHRSISPAQWGSFLMMGGVTEPREPPCAFKYSERNLKRCAKTFDNHRPFLFSFPPSPSKLSGKYSYIQLNFSNCRLSKQELWGINVQKTYSCLFMSCCCGYL